MVSHCCVVWWFYDVVSETASQLLDRYLIRYKVPREGSGPSTLTCPSSTHGQDEASDVVIGEPVEASSP